MKRFKNILYYAEGESAVSPTLQSAVKLARENQARLTLLDVLNIDVTTQAVFKSLGEDAAALYHGRRKEVLEALAEPLRQGGLDITTRVIGGKGFVEVIKAVLDEGYDLVIKAARPPKGFKERLLGSTDMHLLRKCPCPVWLDKSASERPYQCVVAAVDPMTEVNERCARTVMELATSIAERSGAKLEVVHAWQMYGESTLTSGRVRVSQDQVNQILAETQQRHRDKMDQLLQPFGLDCQADNVHLVKGAAASTLQQVTQQLKAELIVMGTVGRTGIPGYFIGNTAEELMQSTAASLLALKPPGFVTPVARMS